MSTNGLPNGVYRVQYWYNYITFFKIIQVNYNKKLTKVTLSNCDEDNCDNAISQNFIKDIIYPICDFLGICKMGRFMKSATLTMPTQNWIKIINIIEKAGQICEDKTVLLITTGKQKVNKFIIKYIANNY